MLERGDPVILFATESLRAGILRNLKVRGLDPDALIDGGRVFVPDPFEALSRIMVNGYPDAGRCEQMIGSLIQGAARNSAGTHTRVTFCGQCAPLLLSKGNQEGAIQLERIWDKITLAHGVDTLCGYISTAIPEENRREVVRRICAEHSRVYGLEDIHS